MHLDGIDCIYFEGYLCVSLQLLSIVRYWSGTSVVFEVFSSLSDSMILCVSVEVFNKYVDTVLKDMV